jgi:hypothetical protein
MALGACSPAGSSTDRALCPIDSGDFAFPALVGGPVRKHGDRRRSADAADRIGENHLHDHGHDHAYDAWRPGAPPVGTHTFPARPGRSAKSVADAWLPARSPHAPAWQAPAAHTLPDPAKVALLAADPASPPLVADAGRIDAAAAATPEVLATLRTELTEQPGFCAATLCRFGPASGPLALVALDLASAATEPQVLGILRGWDGNPFELRLFLEALDEAPAAQIRRAAVGEALSVEEGGRFAEVQRQLDALAAARPGDPFITYFRARNAMARGAAERAVALLEQAVAGPGPTPVVIATRAAVEHEWEELQQHPRVAAALAEVLTRLPETPTAFVAWLDRFRGSPPHLRSAIAPGGPAWVELKVVLDAMTLFEPRVDSTTATFATPGGDVVIGFGPASDGLPSITAVTWPQAWD